MILSQIICKLVDARKAWDEAKLSGNKAGARFWKEIIQDLEEQKWELLGRGKHKI